MLGSTVTIALVTALAGHASAATCVVGRVYCGFTLLGGGMSFLPPLPPPFFFLFLFSSFFSSNILTHPDFNYWQNEMIIANPNLNAGQRSDSTWRCTSNDASGGHLAHEAWCKERPGRACQPNNSGKCTGLNDCCAAA